MDESTYIKYSKGHKYQVKRRAFFCTGIKGYEGNTFYITIHKDGGVLVRAGYAWDGPSGPTFDTKSTLRGSLLHDALYQLMRMEIIPKHERENADQEAFDRWVKDGMWKIRAWVWTRVLNKHAATAAHPDHRKRVYTAP